MEDKKQRERRDFQCDGEEQMELSIKQKNELLTGIILAQELAATIEQTRRFITVKSFEISDNPIE